VGSQTTVSIAQPAADVEYGFLHKEGSRQSLLRKHRETAFELANDAIVLAKTDGTIIDWNERALVLYGYSPTEFSRMRLADLRSPPCRSRFEEDMTALRFRGSRTYETEHQHKNGTILPIEVSVRLIELDGQLYFNGVIRDISERRRTEQRVRTLSRLYATLSEANKAVVVARNRASLFAGVCRACATHGFAMAWVGRIEPSGRLVPAAAEGIGTGYLDGIVITSAPADAATSRGPTGRAATTGEPVICNDFAGDPRTAPWRDRAAGYGWRASASLPLREDGRVVAVLTLYSETPNFFDADEAALLGELAGTISFALDRLAGVERRAAAERTLKQSLHALTSKNIELERFNYVAAHHLQEPARAVVSFCQLLERTLGQRLQPDEHDLFTYIADGARRMRDLVNDLLCLGNVRHVGGAFAPVAIGELAATAIGTLDAPIRAAGGTITVAALPTIKGDAAGLYQVLLHLLGNALKFRAVNRPPAIAIDAKRIGELWSISITDNGIGIEEEYLDSITDAFVRLHPPGLYPGTGIGLTVCKHIVEAHGGTLSIRSQPDNGTTVTLTLATDMAG
jgi:PAS domain S-box-containing protein